MGKSKENELDSKGSFIAQILKGAIWAVFISLIGILIFAFVIKFAGLSSKVIMPVNQVIKGLSILIGVIISLKKNKEKGLLKGVLIGLIYAVISFILFSILSGSFFFNYTFFTDLVFLSIMGAISGIICVNIGRK